MTLEKKTIQEIREDIKRIVVDADWLLRMKALIRDVMEKKVNEIVLRREIYQQCELVVEELLEYLPFLVEFLHPKTDIKEVRKLQEDLEKKSSLLTQVDTKINSIYTKLMEKKIRKK